MKKYIRTIEVQELKHVTLLRDVINTSTDLGFSTIQQYRNSGCGGSRGCRGCSLSILGSKSSNGYLDGVYDEDYIREYHYHRNRFMQNE